MLLEPGFFIPAALYTLLQVLTALTLRDFWLDDILPFSCCPMFMLPRNPFDEWPKWWTMTDAPLSGSTRVTGAMEPLYWSPASPIFAMSPEEARRLPQKVVWFGCTLHCPKEVVGFIQPHDLDQPFLMYSNFDDHISAELKDALQRVVALTVDGEPNDAWDTARMQRLLDVQDECLCAFQASVANARKADGGASKKRD